MDQRSRLLTFPAELRDHVFRLALVNGSPIEVYPEEAANKAALLATCKQIRSEALAIYYSENTFIFPLAWAAQMTDLKWRRAISDRRADLMRDFRIDLDLNLKGTDMRISELLMIYSGFNGMHRRVWIKKQVAKAGVDVNCLSFIARKDEAQLRRTRDAQWYVLPSTKVFWAELLVD